MKKYIITIIYIGSFLSQAQNLISNGNFESNAGNYSGGKPDSLVELKLYNSNNLLVKTFNPVSKFYSMDDMSTGIYFLSVKNKNNEIHLYKIIKL